MIAKLSIINANKNRELFIIFLAFTFEKRFAIMILLNIVLMNLFMTIKEYFCQKLFMTLAIKLHNSLIMIKFFIIIAKLIELIIVITRAS